MGIVDATGNPLRPSKDWSGAVPQASIPRSSFSAKLLGQTLLDLWLAVLGENGHNVTKVDGVEGTDAHYRGAEGVKMISNCASKEIPIQNRPPQQNDANFLLMKFLDERFP